MSPILKDFCTLQPQQTLNTHFHIDVLAGMDHDVFDNLCRLLAHIAKADLIQINFFDGEKFHNHAQYGHPEHKLSVAPEIMHDTLFAGNALEITDYYAHEHYAGTTLIIGQPKFIYYYGVPIIYQEQQRIGVICLAATATLTLDPEKRQIIEWIRDNCGHIASMRQEQIASLKTLGKQLDEQLQLSFTRKLSAKTNSKLLTLNKQLEETNRQLEAANAQLQQLSITDQMTMCLNRRALFDILPKELKRASRDKLPLSIIMLDVDFFKPYNDHYGHVLGDQCLAKVARALLSVLNRPADILARYGGEDFTYVLPNTNQEGAENIAKAAIAAVQELKIPHDYSQCSSIVTISLGIKTLNPDDDSIDLTQLIDLADAARHEAKNAGRCRYAISKKT